MTLYEKLVNRLGGLFRRMYKLNVIGEENVPADGAFVLGCNHTALFDPIMLILSVPRTIRFMAKKESFKTPVIGRLMAKLGMIPVNRGTADLKAMKASLSCLKEGGVIGIFPQGTRCPGVDPETTKPKDGVAMLSYRTNSPVLPAFIVTKGRKLRPFCRTTVVIGKPIKPEELMISSGTPSEYKAATELIWSRICDLEDKA